MIDAFIGLRDQLWLMNWLNCSLGPDLLAHCPHHSHHQLLHWNLHSCRLKGTYGLLWLWWYEHMLISQVKVLWRLNSHLYLLITLRNVSLSSVGTVGFACCLYWCLNLYFPVRFNHVGKHGSGLPRRDVLLCVCYLLPCSHWYSGWSQHFRRPCCKPPVIMNKTPLKMRWYISRGLSWCSTFD